MNDPEFHIRQNALNFLSPSFHCVEHADATIAAGARGQIDVLCRPLDPRLTEFTLAIEVKAYTVVGDREVGPWLKQAADYVGAVPANGWPRVCASFAWLVGVQLNPNVEERLRIAGMFQLAQHFRVGKAYIARAGLTFVFGPSAEIYREKRGGWTSRAVELLEAKRVLAGVRKKPEGFGGDPP